MTKEEAVKLYKSGMMVKDVAEAYGTSYSTMWRILNSKKALRGKKKSINLSVKQGRFTKNRKSKKGMKMPKHVIEAAIAANRAKGKGWRITSSGYVEFTRGKHQGRAEHTVLMEKKIGRKLKANECVHHKNHKKTDNRIENLQLMTRSEHARIHALENHLNRERDSSGRFL